MHGRSNSSSNRGRPHLGGGARPAGLVQRAFAVGASAAVVLGGLTVAPALGLGVTSAVFSGGTGTVSVGSTLYAKQGAAVTLTVVTTTDTRCVTVTGTGTDLPIQHSDGPKSNWTFTESAPSGNGVRAFSVAASPGWNGNIKNPNCTGSAVVAQASYTLDDTGPVVAGVVDPAPSSGWNNSDVKVKWTATDAGSGVAGEQPFRTDTVTTEGVVALTAPAQADRLGNTGSAGSITVRVDKTAPTITATQSSAGYGQPTTVTFTCEDTVSGIASCLADGSSSNSKTVSENGAVTGTAIDTAGNTKTLSVEVKNVDTTAPTLSGSPMAPPNGEGWYSDDVNIHWTAEDPESGIPDAPADTTITGEGAGLTSSTSVTNGAGLTTSATSSPAVNIDRTAPTTAISGGSNSWVNDSVNITLSTSDSLSGVASTTYTVDGQAPQSGTSFSLADEGDHTVTFFSTDKAGNVGELQTAHVKIDKTAPTIAHSFEPLTYENGAWTNEDVTVTFTCADQGGSKVADCSSPVTKTDEGSHTVTGTATDGAGNSATDSASVRIDKTPPVITAATDRPANEDGWYNDNVTVSFTSSDKLSGMASTSDSELLSEEGANQSVSGTAVDAAGNSASAGVSGINIDKTAPVLTGSFRSGWHSGDVTVSWTCTDTLSGPASQPADSVVSGEGDNLSATASCADKAGNITTESVEGIRIDRHAPTTTAHVPDANSEGWYASAVDVELTGIDRLSGVEATFYSVDGGPAQPYTDVFSFDDEGTHEISFWSSDKAGNVEEAGAPITLKVDKTAPTTEVKSPISPATGWFVISGIPVAFDAGDNLSGIAATYYSIDGGSRKTYGEPFTADLSSGTHTITYWSVDLAGNEEAHETTNTVEVKVDTVAPTISGSRTPAANAFGWNKTDVKVSFTCADEDSRIDEIIGCGPDQTVSSEGSNQSVQGYTQDVAGNGNSATVDAINIDKTAPLVGLVGGPADGATYYYGSVPVAPTCSGSDGMSGIDGACEVSGYSNKVGKQTVTASVIDRAGNQSTVSRTYNVKAWTLSGFYSPVDMGGVVNTVKAGSTVPLKFEVFAGPTERTAVSDVSFAAKKISCQTSAVTDDLEMTSSGGTSLRYDATGGQFIQNWQTPKTAGECYQVTMTALDGSPIAALFKLK